ncbi:MAG: amino acid permease [Gammaproteobacteria bacterium]|nr:amino acid permease [Gammaproteobacteria bacterium]
MTKALGVWRCSSLVIGNMVGSGIFLLPASLAPYGGVSIIGWLLTTLGALMTALVFVNLSRRYPRQGGPYRYAYEQFGALPAFVVAWSYWVSIWCGNAAISVAAVTYLSFFFPVIEQNNLIAVVVSMSLLWMATYINVKGIREAALAQMIVTVLKIIPLLFIGGAAFFVFDLQAFKPLNTSDLSMGEAINATAALTLWAFLGLESATIPADNVDDPKRTIPKATLIGFAITAFIYISCQVAIVSVVPNEQLITSGAPFADAAKIIWGGWAGYLIAAGAVLSCLGALNGWVLLQGQVPMTAARDNLLPNVFKDNKKDGVSKFALIFSSIIISILIWFNFSKGMVSLFTFAIMVSTLGIFMPYLLSIFAEMKYLVKNKKLFSNISSSLFSVLAFLYCVWAIIGIGSKAIVWGVILILAGLPVYFGYQWHRSRH